MNKIKPCPFCGEEDELLYGEAYNPDAWWDSAMRGEVYGYIKCVACGCILKANDLKGAIERWNKRITITGGEE